MAKLKNYSIVRSNNVFIVRVILIVIIADFVFGLLSLLIALLRETLDVSTTFSISLWLVFMANIIITATGVYLLMRNWLSVRYFVIGEELVVQTVERKKSVEDIYDLTRIRSARVDQTGFAKSLNAGTITLKIADAQIIREDTVVLSDIENPREIARLLKAQRKTGKRIN